MSEIWTNLQREIHTEIKDSGMLKAIFSGIEFLGLEGDSLPTLKLGVSNSLSLGIAQRDLQDIIQMKIEQTLNKRVIVNFETSEKLKTRQLELLDEPQETIFELRSPDIELKPKWFLNLDYKLSQFINGDHSNFAYKSIEMLTAANQPHLRQLFLYGPSGNGKTHLLHALGWRFKDLQPNLNVKIFTADEFINDYHMYIAKKQMAEFRGKYRLKTDVLLIDDIHGLARAKGAQEELFNIFNYFEQTGKFTAFTSDKSPHQLESFEPRLLTRFQGGLSTEISAPCLATRIKILEFKQSKYGFHLATETLTHIAHTIANSVRSLEGALYKVGSYQYMKGSQVTKDELIKLIPSAAGSLDSTEPTIDSILATIATASDLKISDLKSTSRKRQIVQARNSAMLRMREELSLSYSEIGRIFGKDHSTIMSALKKSSS